MSKIAGWRLRKGNYKLPVEQKLFDLYVRMSGQRQAAAEDYEDYQQLQPEAHEAKMATMASGN
jgi:hypothetical protein